MTHGFRLERLIDASPDAVFDALTDPAAQHTWWSEGRPIDAACDLRVGGAAHVRWTADDGHSCLAEQVFIEIDRPHRLVYDERVTESDAAVYTCRLEFTFTERDGKTLLALDHRGFPSVAERDKHEGGTQIFLDRLERYVRRIASADAHPR